MRNISTAIAATLALATTALAVEYAHHQARNAPAPAQEPSAREFSARKALAQAAAAPPKQSAGKENLEVIEIWTEDAPAAPTQTGVKTDKRIPKGAGDETASPSATPAARAADAPTAQRSEATWGANASQADTKPPVLELLGAKDSGFKTRGATDAKATGAKSAEPVTETAKPAPEAPAATTASNIAAEPATPAKPRHARRAPPRRSAHRETKGLGPKSLGAASQIERRPGEGAFWRRGAGSYRFSGSFGGCVFRGSVGLGGYRIKRSC